MAVIGFEPNFAYWYHSVQYWPVDKYYFFF